MEQQLWNQGAQTSGPLLEVILHNVVLLDLVDWSVEVPNCGAVMCCQQRSSWLLYVCSLGQGAQRGTQL